MEYAFDISGRNDNYIRHVGYNDDNAIELAHKVRENIIVKKEIKEVVIESKTSNLLEHMEIDEE